MLKKIGSFNDFPSGFKQPKLKKGEEVIYRLLDSVPDPNNKGLERFPPSVKVRSIDRVVINDEGDTVDIGLVRQIDKDGIVQNVRYVKIAGQENAGYIRLVGGNIADEELYAYFELCNYNSSNKYRDVTVHPVFTKIDTEKEANELRKKRSAKLSAMTYAANMNLTAVREYAAARNWEQNAKEDVLRQQIEKFAETEPDAFMKSVQDKDLSIRATIKRAIDANNIAFDVAQSKWYFVKGGETIALVARVAGVEPFEGLVDFIKTHKKGDAVYSEIQKSGKSEVKPEIKAEVKTELPLK